ncbi:outer membrane lipoprotein-sorting protein [Thiospirochaeta perfilievii]|uniref:Outer membrane lipoprotein-sorting protein n=1 Tax=Thiospirochaeta perfilievii TaxID=252967 RepID=A0A5C1QGC5_9SPIO|nr:outer membrane lipoprotein-sorting protein [Thiospirochaeta perfilievii]QEN06119.1 outer membrane lipoprotein-sorting protein [Thiospirochaeta perfilievii]
MKKLWITLLLLISMTLFGDNLDNILNEFANRIRIPNLYGKFSITLISKNGDKREIKADAYQKMSDNNQMNRLFLFSYPPSVRDTGFLIHSFYSEGENKMWIYLPVVKKIKRISLENSGGGYFMGSDFSYSDFISRSYSNYTQELIGEEIIENQNCYVVKEYGTTLEEKNELGYSYIINYYNKQTSFLIGRDFYELSGELLKTYRVKKIKVLGEYIYPTEIVMENQQNKHKSIISVTDIEIKELPDRYFTTRFLTR